ncbi:exported protein of unknown function [Nitrospira moscoviensis]|uniref:Uncharacterized protein n=1 Tax=Nitrospira moscoviensis TaxID=42253 RepID=A0A0K2GJF6_NITMO|nr:exported protein of unknown function [Nitrospira moscoviensis]
MLKTVPCVVLASLKSSTCSEHASDFRSLRPSNELVLSILPTALRLLRGGTVSDETPFVSYEIRTRRLTHPTLRERQATVS